jgi:hypothetical protein
MDGAEEAAAERLPSVEEHAAALVQRVWHEIIGTVLKLRDADARFGWLNIVDSINPSIEDIVLSLAAMDGLLDGLLTSPLLKHDQIRQGLNSKQCILHIRQLAEALKVGDQDEYERAMCLLKKESLLD